MFETQNCLAEPNRGILDRTELATCLRRAGVDVDFEDWDTLQDDSVRQIVEHVAQRADLVQNPARQLGIVSALYCGDAGMFERAADSGLFAMLMEVGDEV